MKVEMCPGAVLTRVRGVGWAPPAGTDYLIREFHLESVYNLITVCVRASSLISLRGVVLKTSERVTPPFPQWWFCLHAGCVVRLRKSVLSWVVRLGQSKGRL